MAAVTYNITLGATECAVTLSTITFSVVGAGGLGEATSDGKLYGRKSGAWAEADAAAITVDATAFTGNLSATDTDVQTALATIDAMTSAATPEYGESRRFPGGSAPAGWTIQGSVLSQTATPGYVATFAKVGLLPHVSSFSDKDSNDGHIIQKIAFGNGRFVLVKNYFIKYSADNGQTWVDCQPGGPLYKLWRSVAYSASLAQWCAVGETGELWTSADNGTTWTSRTSSFGATNIYDVAWAGTQWIAVGDDGKIATSANGVDWSQQTGAWGDAIRAIASSGDISVAVTPYAKIQTSVNGATWIEEAYQASGYGLQDVCYASVSKTFFATGYVGSVYISANGKDWYAVEVCPQAGASSYVQRVGTDGTRALVLMGNGQTFWVFANGEIRPGPGYGLIAVNVGGVAAGNGAWVVGGEYSRLLAAVGVSSYNVATNFRLPSAALDAGVFSDTYYYTGV